MAALRACRYGFNAGSTQCFYNCMHLSSQIAVNTTLGAATGGATVLCLIVLLGSPGDVAPVLNGILSGEHARQTRPSHTLYHFHPIPCKTRQIAVNTTLGTATERATVLCLIVLKGT